jgi:hypothetical protein
MMVICIVVGVIVRTVGMSVRLMLSGRLLLWGMALRTVLLLSVLGCGFLFGLLFFLLLDLDLLFN